MMLFNMHFKSPSLLYSDAITSRYLQRVTIEIIILARKSHGLVTLMVLGLNRTGRIFYRYMYTNICLNVADR